MHGQQPARKKSKASTRREKVESGTGRVIKEKFMEERQQSVKNKPLVPMSKKQQLYMDLLNEKSVIIATGYAGTSKTYLPTAMAADLFKLGKIEKIIVTRPAISTSKSLGYFSGDSVQKLSVWLNSVIPIFKERLGLAAFELALSTKNIEFVPLEVIKGMSINDAWVLVEESSDLTKEEVIKMVTRMGKNSKLVLSGDIRQSELEESSGLVWISKFVQRHDLQENFGFVDFNDVNDIVRSDATKQFIVALVRDEKSGRKNNA
jgi:phosphate starvation-inducible PhoH-like protein